MSYSSDKEDDEVQVIAPPPSKKVREEPEWANLNIPGYAKLHRTSGYEIDVMQPQQTVPNDPTLHQSIVTREFSISSKTNNSGMSIVSLIDNVFPAKPYAFDDKLFFFVQKQSSSKVVPGPAWVSINLDPNNLEMIEHVKSIYDPKEGRVQGYGQYKGRLMLLTKQKDQLTLREWDYYNGQNNVCASFPSHMLRYDTMNSFVLSCRIRFDPICIIVSRTMEYFWVNCTSREVKKIPFPDLFTPAGHSKAVRCYNDVVVVLHDRDEIGFQVFSDNGDLDTFNTIQHTTLWYEVFENNGAIILCTQNGIYKYVVKDEGVQLEMSLDLPNVVKDLVALNVNQTFVCGFHLVENKPHFFRVNIADFTCLSVPHAGNILSHDNANFYAHADFDFVAFLIENEICVYRLTGKKEMHMLWHWKMSQNDPENLPKSVHIREDYLYVTRGASVVSFKLL